MSLQSQISLLATRIGQEVKAVRALVNSQAVFNATGPVGTFTGTQRFYVFATGNITIAKAMLGTSGSTTTTVLIKKNGSTAYTLSLTSGNVVVTSTSTVAVTAGDYLTVDVSAAGTGAVDLSVAVRIME